MIHLENLQVEADDFVLEITELTILPGEYMVLVGPTGSGKTVLLETIAGLRRPKRGHIWFGDREVTDVLPEHRGVGFVYQDYALFPHLSVADNIGFGLRAEQKASGPAEVERLANLLGIADLLVRYPDSLSGGERQRVALARALAIQPQILLLDEPLSALDRGTREELRRELKRLHETLGTTVLHVTHDLDEALALGHRLAVLVGGCLRQTGSPAQVLRRPINGEVAQMLGMSNVFPVCGVTSQGEYLSVTLQGENRAKEKGKVKLTCALPADELGSGPWLAVIPSEEIVLIAGENHGQQQGSDRPFLSHNLLQGTITEVEMETRLALIRVEVPPIFTVHVMRPQVTRPGLTIGSRVAIYIPPEAVHVCSGPA